MSNSDAGCTTRIKRVVIAQCTKDKRKLDDGETIEARKLYDESSYFRKQRDYAKQVADAWFIQSAKYGLVAPGDELAYYNKHAKNLDDIPGWVQEQADDLAGQIPADATVEVLGGDPYDRLADELSNRGYDVETPLAGQRFGPRQRSLAQMVNTTLEAY